MDVFKRETKKIVGCFLLHQISFAECLIALDDALASLMRRDPEENSSALRELMFANNAQVMREMERRGVSAGFAPPLSVAAL